MNLPISTLCITPDALIKDALSNINDSGLGFCFVCDNTSFFRGIITDGDVRRCLLSGSTLTSSVSVATNCNCCCLNITHSTKDLLAKFSLGYSVIPLVDDNGLLVDYATPSFSHSIPVLSPDLAGNELSYVTNCIQSSWISSQGQYVSRFESDFSRLHQDFNALAVSNGTVALYLILKTLPFNPGDEVILPNITFAACINVILDAGLTPVLCDIDRTSWCLDTIHLQQLISSKTKAIMAVHLFGNVCDMESLDSICNKYNLYLIEDCAEAIGSQYRGLPVGTFGDAASFSFFGNKTITTGEGGMVLFKDKNLFDKANILRDHGMSKNKRYWHEYVGFNYRMTNLQAAVGCAQLERFNEIISKKVSISALYDKLLSDSPFIYAFPSKSPSIKHSNWLYTVILAPFIPIDDLLDKLQRVGIECRKTFFPLNIMPPYSSFNTGSYPNSLLLANQGISFPSSTTLLPEEVTYITSSFTRICNKYY